MTDHLPSKALAIALERVAEYRKTRHMIGMPYQAYMIALADEIDRLQRENDTCGLQCSATMKSLLAENDRLRTALTGISTCSACEACRGAALRALGVVAAKEPSRELIDYGYAPGGYIITCFDCKEKAWDCDKRAAVCKPCAEKRRDRAAQPPGDGWDANGSPVGDAT